MLRKAILYEKINNNTVRCSICLRRCRIKEGGEGYCLTRINRNGKLFSTIYGDVSVLGRAPIEIKPVYHYMPGSHALSLGSVGCNFLCRGCQNWDISFALKNHLNVQTTHISPENAIQTALKEGCQGISWTYNEPTLWFEYTLDTARLAKKLNLYTNYVSNGYITQEALDRIGPYLDIFRIDIKGFSKKSYRETAGISNWENILDTAVRAKSHWKMHVELVTNIIPGINDDRAQILDLIDWIKDELGADTPWHITRFFPRWHMKNHEATPLRTIDNIYETALSEGLHFVYVGNIPGHRGTDTLCPKCGKRIIRRETEKVICFISSGRCQYCGQVIYGKFD